MDFLRDKKGYAENHEEEKDENDAIVVFIATKLKK